MRHITKGPEPELFSKWKNDNHGLAVVWEDLASDAKRALRDALLAEQGHICCYCGERLLGHHWPIEHLKPRTTFPGLTFDYSNMLASCPGGEKGPLPRLLHCDKKRGNWNDDELMVSPLNPDCEGYFVFRSNGTIEPTDDPEKKRTARETIKRLGLDIEKLNGYRNKALEAIQDVLDSGTDHELRALIEGVSRPDAEGRLAPFCFALVQVLKRYT
jgi:uncharacterized protein (TIGR02646 family)